MTLSRRCPALVYWPVTTVLSVLSLSDPKESSGFSRMTLSTNRESSTLDSEREVHVVTTVSPVNIPNHQPVFKSLLFQERLIMKDFQGDQHFFRRDGSVAGYSTLPGSVSASEARDVITQLVPHEDAPAFSDIATTATVAATSPRTTFFPTTPKLPISLPQKKSLKDGTRGEDKHAPTTISLTTQAPPNIRGSASEHKPVASVSAQSGQPQTWSPFPAGATLAPSSVWMDKGEEKEAGVKNKSSPSNPLPNFTSTSPGNTTQLPPCKQQACFL